MWEVNTHTTYHRLSYCNSSSDLRSRLDACQIFCWNLSASENLSRTFWEGRVMKKVWTSGIIAWKNRFTSWVEVNRCSWDCSLVYKKVQRVYSGSTRWTNSFVSQWTGFNRVHTLITTLSQALASSTTTMRRWRGRTRSSTSSLRSSWQWPSSSNRSPGVSINVILQVYLYSHFMYMPSDEKVALLLLIWLGRSLIFTTTSLFSCIGCMRLCLWLNGEVTLTDTSRLIVILGWLHSWLLISWIIMGLLVAPSEQLQSKQKLSCKYT